LNSNQTRILIDFSLNLKTLFFDSLISLYNSPLSFNNLSAVLNNYAIP